MEPRPKSILKTPAIKAQQREAERLRFLAAAQGEINCKLLFLGSKASGKSAVIQGLETTVVGAPSAARTKGEEGLQLTSFVAASVDSRPVYLHCFEVPLAFCEEDAPSSHLEILFSGVHACVVCCDAAAGSTDESLALRYAQGDLAPADIDKLTEPLKAIDKALSVIRKHGKATPLVYLLLHKSDSVAHLATSQLSLLKTLGSAQALFSLTPPAMNLLAQQQQQLLAAVAEPAPLLVAGLNADDITAFAASAGIKRWYWSSVNEGGSTSSSNKEASSSAAGSKEAASSNAAASSAPVAANAIAVSASAPQQSTASRVTAALLGGVGLLPSTPSSSQLVATVDKSAVASATTAPAPPAVPHGSLAIIKPSTSLARFLADLIDDCLRHWPALLQHPATPQQKQQKQLQQTTGAGAEVTVRAF